MKKIILLISCFWLLFAQEVFAATFQESKHMKYHYVLTKDGVAKDRDIIYVTDVLDQPYYDIMPERPFLINRNYDKFLLNYDLELQTKISEIMYFGYRYKENTAYNYYHATQYLLYEAFGYTVDVLNTQGESEIFFQQEIDEVRAILEESHFHLKDFATDSRSFVLDDAYILENYNVSGDDMEILEIENKLEIHFLDNVSSYTLTFAPKDDCSTVEYWRGNTSTGLLHMDTVCEKARTITVTNEGMPTLNDTVPSSPKQEETESKKDIISNDEEKDLPILEEEYEVREVPIPSTSNYSCSWIFFLFLLGNLYYVFKK